MRYDEKDFEKSGVKSSNENVSYEYISGLTICFSFILGSCIAVSLFSFKPFMIDTHFSYHLFSSKSVLTVTCYFVSFVAYDQEPML